ncbi:hypothetical protein ACU5AY_11200 [Rhizobium sp. PAMB 3174]
MCEQDVVMIPSADLDALESAIDALSRLQSNAPLICLRFLAPDLGERSANVRRRRLLKLAEIDRSKISLFSETFELAEHLKTEYGIPVTGGFYLPCSMEINTRVEQPSTARKFRIGVLGLPKSRKGSPLVPQIVAALDGLISSRTARQFEFVVQGAAHHFSPSGVYGPLKTFVNSGKDVSVSPLDAGLSPAEFIEVFKTMDLILLPYDRSIYGLQGSGVIQDAIVAQKPLVHASGLSMADLLCHGNAIAAASIEEYAKAVVAVAGSRNEFLQGTERAAQFYKQYFDKHPLLDVLEAASFLIDPAH